MKKVRLLAAMLAMVLAAAVPALAETKAAAVQYQYAAAAQYQYSVVPGLPLTGGSSLIALGVGVLLVVGGLLARKMVR